MGTDIESGPIEDRLKVRGLDGEIDVGGDHGGILYDHAERDTQCALPRSADAVHRADISGAHIPAVSSVVIASSRQAITMKRSYLIPPVRVRRSAAAKSPIQWNRNSFLRVIATNSQ